VKTTTHERGLSGHELRTLMRGDLGRPGHARHPRGDSAGLLTLRAAFTAVIADHLGQPHATGKGGANHG